MVYRAQCHALLGIWHCQATTNLGYAGSRRGSEAERGIFLDCAPRRNMGLRLGFLCLLVEYMPCPSYIYFC